MEIIFLNTSHLIFHTTNRLPEPTIASLQKLSMGTHEKIWNPQVLLRNEQQKDNVSCCFSVRRTLWFLCAQLGTQVTFRDWKIWCNEIKFAHVSDFVALYFDNIFVIEKMWLYLLWGDLYSVRSIAFTGWFIVKFCTFVIDFQCWKFICDVFPKKIICRT